MINNIDNSSKINELNTNSEDDRLENLLMEWEEIATAFVKDYAAIVSKHGGYYLSACYFGANNEGNNVIRATIHDKRSVRLFRDKSFNNIEKLLPKEYSIKEGDNTKKYSVEVIREREPSDILIKYVHLVYGDNF